MTDERYVELAEKARDALYDLLRASDPGTGWSLQVAYRDLKKTLDRGEEKERQDACMERRREQLARDRAWRAVSTPERERLVLEVLGDERLTVKEITDRIAARLPDCAVYPSYMARLIRNMFRARELDRDGERHWGYRYWRRGLEGPIADLERTFHEQREERR